MFYFSLGWAKTRHDETRAHPEVGRARAHGQVRLIRNTPSIMVRTGQTAGMEGADCGVAGMMAAAQSPTHPEDFWEEEEQAMEEQRVSCEL